MPLQGHPSHPPAPAAPSAPPTASLPQPAAETEFSFDNLPASALDGFQLDEQDVLDAIARVDTQSVEQEAQVLETVEAIGLSSSDEFLEDTMENSVVSHPASPALPPLGAHSETPDAPPPGGKPVIRRGFY
jgi:hypothetical protein